MYNKTIKSHLRIYLIPVYNGKLKAVNCELHEYEIHTLQPAIWTADAIRNSDHSTSHGMTGRNFFDVFLPFYLLFGF